MIGHGFFDMFLVKLRQRENLKLKSYLLKIQFLSMKILADLITIHFLRSHVVFTYSSSQNQLKNMVTKYTHF